MQTDVTPDDARTSSILKFKDYRDVLRSEFERRREKNARYSLRAFARDLEFNGATLTEVLSDKKGISHSKARQIAERLNLSTEESNYFVDLVLARHSRIVKEREQAAERIRQIHPSVVIQALGEQTHGEVLSDWKSLVLLEMITIGLGKIDAYAAASLLEQTPNEIESSLKKLLDAGFIEQTADGYKRRIEFSLLNSQIPSEVARNFHRAVLDQAMRSISEQNISQRKAVSSIVSIKESKFAEARDFLEKTRDEFFERFASDESPDTVCGLSFNLFHLIPASKESHV